LWKQVQPHRYPYRCETVRLPWALVLSLFHRIPSLAVMGRTFGGAVGVQAKSTLADLVTNPRIAGLMAAMWQTLENPGNDGDRGRLVAIDSMPLTMPASRRSDAPRLNRDTRGIGVLWSLALDALPGKVPVRIIELILRPWNDGKILRHHPLTPNGPIYLLDRGFYGFELIGQLLERNVHFIMRAKKHQMRHTLIAHRSLSRQLPGGVRVELDAIVTLGGPQSRLNPVVRLIKAYLPAGADAMAQDLFVVTDLTRPSAQTVLADYRRREEIEKFHQALKSAIGLAHLYSFQTNGLQTLLYATLLLAALVFTVAPDGDAHHAVGVLTVASILVQSLKNWRELLRVATPWKRNIHAKQRWKKRRR
jgi:hypothetical protein